MVRGQKFKPPVFARGRKANKRNEHDAKWIADVVGAVAAGTPKELKGLPIAYHGQAPHQETDESVEVRASVAPREPADVPGTSDMTRKISTEQYPTAVGHHSPNMKAGTYGTLPAKGQATSNAPVRKPGDV